MNSLDFHKLGIGWHWWFKSPVLTQTGLECIVSETSHNIHTDYCGRRNKIRPQCCVKGSLCPPQNIFFQLTCQAEHQSSLLWLRAGLSVTCKPPNDRGMNHAHYIWSPPHPKELCYREIWEWEKNTTGKQSAFTENTVVHVWQCNLVIIILLLIQPGQYR